MSFHWSIKFKINKNKVFLEKFNVCHFILFFWCIVSKSDSDCLYSNNCIFLAITINWHYGNVMNRNQSWFYWNDKYWPYRQLKKLRGPLYLSTYWHSRELINLSKLSTYWFSCTNKNEWPLIYIRWINIFSEETNHF